MSSAVVVGYDRSAPSRQALLVGTPMVFTPPRLQDVYDKAAMEIAEEGVDHVRAQYPDLLLGSVSIRVLAGASCPVVVVRGAGEDSVAAHDRVVAAVDIDDPGCAGVLAFAFDEAAQRHAELVAVYVSEDEGRWVMEQNLVAAGLRKTSTEVSADADERLAVAVLHAQARQPEVKASHQVVTGTSGKVLTGDSSRADLVVVGAHRRHGQHAGMRIGPVATTLLHHADCPVAVVPHS